MTNYSAERFDPKLHRPVGLSLLFDGWFLSFKNGPTTKLWDAYSGKPINGELLYTVERQKKKGEGPIPEGTYWINPAEFHDNRPAAYWNDFIDDGAGDAHLNSWGKHRITIHPFTTTETFGRGGFFLHGGSTPGSAGCIDVLDKISEVRTLIEEAAEPHGTGCQIHLKVDYTQKNAK